MVGYSFSNVPTSDPEYNRLRARCHATQGTPEYQAAYYELYNYNWNKACEQVRIDRLKHPKAKRNQPVPTRTPPPYEGLPT